MEVKYSLKEDDFIKFNLYHNQNSALVKKRYNILRYLPVFLYLICAVEIFGFDNLLNIFGSIIMILLALVWVVKYPKIHKKIITKQIKNTLKEGDNSCLFDEQTLIIDEDNMRIINESASFILSNKSIKDVEIHDDMIVIYRNGFTAHVIPTRYLDEESENRIINELNRLQMQHH